MTDRMIPFSDLAPTTAEVRDEVSSQWQALLDTGAFIGGAAVQRFEEHWAAYCGRAHAVGVANGTDALHLVLRALSIGPGDEVLVPANTFIATAEAVVLAGATPRFVDVDPQTLLVTPELFEAALTPRTAALMPVHLYGHVVDVEAVADVAQRHGLAMIEDAAQAHGAVRDGRRAGSRGVAAGFSFYPGKNLGAFGDGGAVVTDDRALADKISSLANHGRSTSDRYRHPNLGTNSRLDALQAIVLDAKLSRLDGWTARRQAVVDTYRDRLSGVEGVTLVEPSAGVTSAWHLLVARSPSATGCVRISCTSACRRASTTPCRVLTSPPSPSGRGRLPRVDERCRRDRLPSAASAHVVRRRAHRLRGPGEVTVGSVTS
jgi:dTDP-4-amino-4,6-dideoxygalactose transaminase